MVTPEARVVYPGSRWGSRSRRAVAAALSLVCAAALAPPCIWDSDTLDTELRGLPDAFDLVVGRWHRHSDAYYQRRVRQLAGRDDLSFEQFDDLAVAYEHLGRRDEAVDVMAAKAEALGARDDEEHRYRCLANLGTFHAHAGRYDDALAALREAVALNPEAHFGRERFQIELIEYVAAAKVEPALWSESNALRYAGYSPEGHDGSFWVRSDWMNSDGNIGDRRLDWDAAYRAVGGMLRFGGLEGAELYRMLGDLFLLKGHLNLSWWSMWRAIERGHPAASAVRARIAWIEGHWREARVHGKGSPATLLRRVPDLSDYRAARAEADRWLEAFQRLEEQAIERGEDVASDEVLSRLLAEADREVPRSSIVDAAPWNWPLLGFLVLGTAGVVLLVRWSRRLRRSANAAAQRPAANPDAS